MKAHKARELSSSLPPHIYTLVGQAYGRMRQKAAKSLSILISGFGIGLYVMLADDAFNGFWQDLMLAPY